MNRCYRLVWNTLKSTWQAVPECGRGHGRKKSPRVRATRVALTVALATGGAYADGLPTGGTIVAGSGTISQTANTMTISQATAKMAVNWQGFSVGSGNTVNFVQPNAAAVALNTVLGADVSVIQGAINANGQVFLINPNGVLFSPTAQVNVGSLVAATLKMSTADFMAGNYRLSGDSSNAVVNQGNITAAGGSIALVAAQVSNEGSLSATGGNVLLGAGSEISLDLGGPVKLQVTQGALDAQIKNGGAIQADGGLVYLTAKSVSELTTATINNTGVIRAQTLATGEKGEIRLMGDMATGAVYIDGLLDASAPNGGDGGFIETSASRVKIAHGVEVTTRATEGANGSWLIDPVDFTIAPSGGDIDGTTLGSLLTGGSVTIDTRTPLATGYTLTASVIPGYGYYGHDTGASGDIFVNDNISGYGSLSLLAARNITVNNSITGSGGALDIVLKSAMAPGATVGGVAIKANLNSNGGNITIGGGATNSAYTYTGNSGFALNFYNGSADPLGTGSVDNHGAAVYVAAGKSITSYNVTGSGDITIKGLSTVGKVGGSVDIERSGILVDASSGLTTSILSGYGTLTMVGDSSGGSNTMGLAFRGPSGSVTAFGNGTDLSTALTSAANPKTGLIPSMGIYGWNTSGGVLTAAGSLYLAQKGQAQLGVLRMMGYALSDQTTYVNGVVQTPMIFKGSGCGSVFPACGFFKVPAANSSYPYVGYNFVKYARVTYIEVDTPIKARDYDGTTTATFGTNNADITLTDPTGLLTTGSFSFATSSPNAGLYLSLTPTLTPTGGSSTGSDVYTPGSGTYSGQNIPVVYVYSEYTINKAALGINLNATYNGTKAYTGTIKTNNLASGDSISSVGINLANVADNSTDTSGVYAGNYITTVTGTMVGGGTNLLDNYTISGSAKGTPTTGTPGATDTNTVTLSRAPLGIALTATYNSTTTFNIVNNGGTALSPVSNGSSPSIYTNSALSGVTTGGSIIVNGLVGGDTLSSVTLNNAYVSSASAINGISGTAGGSGGVNLGNYYVYTNGSISSPGTATNNSSTCGATCINTSNNTANIGKASLGINLNAIYNGLLTYSDTDTTTSDVKTNGLLGSDSVSSVGINSRNVVDNTTNVNTGNYISSVTGTTAGGSNLLSNYTINGSANGTPTTGTPGSKTTNTVTLSPAPLGVAVSGTYTGSATLTTAGGATINTYGLVGQDLLGGTTVNSATLSSANASTVNNKVVSVSGTVNFLASNYVLDGSYNTAAATAGTNPNGSGATNTSSIAKVALGINLNGVYNGTTTFSDTDTTASDVKTNGLVNGDTVSSVGIHSANVADNSTDTSGTYAGNYIATVTGTTAGGTNLLDNYTISSSAHGTPTTGNPGATDTNTVTLSRAQLGIALSATYNGTTTFNLVTAGAAATTKSNGYGQSTYTNSGSAPTTAATISINGLVGGDTLGGVVLNSKNVSTSSAITGISGTAGAGGGVNLSNYYVYTNGSISSPGTPTNHPATTCGSSCIDTTNNTAVVGKALLGIDVLGVYNGTNALTIDGTALSLTNSVIHTNGLVNGETITGVTITKLNVGQNGSNAVSTATGASGFDIANYQLGSSQYYTGTTPYDGTQTGTPDTTTNSVWLKPAPLGVAVSGTYNGTTTMTAGGTTTITGYGLRGQDTSGVSLLTATLSSGVAGTSAKVTAVTGSGTFDPANYVLDGTANPASATPGTALDGSGATNTANINKALLIITANNQTKEYGAADPTLTYSTSGLQGSDALTGNLTRAAGETVAGGPYAITQGTLNNANYTISFVGANLTITPKGITVTADAKTKVYGSVDPALTYSVTGLNGSDTLTGALSRAAGETVAGGPYAIGQGSLGNSNYRITFIGANLTITPKGITVVADDKTKVYGNADPTLTWTANGLINNDTLTGALSRALGENVVAGPYAINQGTLANNNYSITFTNGRLTITPRPITVVADDKSKNVGTPDPALTYRATSGSLVGNDSLGLLTRTPGETVGSYVIDASKLANSNYLITAINGTLRIVSLPPPPPSPIIVPAFVDNGSRALTTDVSPMGLGGLNYVLTPGGTEQGGGTPSTLNFVSGRAGDSEGNAGMGGAGEQATGTPSTLNFVSKESGEGGDQNANGSGTPGEQSTGTPSTLNFVANESAEGGDQNADGGESGDRKQVKDLNVNNVTVSSAAGPLDVIVVGTGTNRRGVATMKTISN